MKIWGKVLAYGMSKYKLADTIQVTVEEAEGIINRFFKAVPKVKEFLTNVGKLGMQRGYIRTGPVYSRIRWFPKWKLAMEAGDSAELGNIERASMNSPLQGSNGNLIKLVLIRLNEEILKNNWAVNILLSIYDEIQTECREDQAEAWKIKLEQIMIDCGKEFIKSIPVVCDCKISDYWGK